MKSSHKIIGLLVVSFLVFGFLDAQHPDKETMSTLMHALIIGVCMYMWCDFHAYENRIVRPPGAAILCFLLVPIGLPYYLFKGFGFKKTEESS